MSRREDPTEDSNAQDSAARSNRRHLECRFTTAAGKRCHNPVVNSTLGLCFHHERRARKLDDAETRAITEELLSGTEGSLQSRNDVHAALSKLFVLVSQKRISRPDGTLLAYIGSLVLQTLPPMSIGPTDDERARETSAQIRAIFSQPRRTPEPSFQESEVEPEGE
jgi:hypothetical protein